MREICRASWWPSGGVGSSGKPWLGNRFPGMMSGDKAWNASRVMKGGEAWGAQTPETQLA